MKRYFHTELDTLRSHLLLMGEKAIDAVQSSVDSLMAKDVNIANKVIAQDDEIDNLEVDIDHEATRYLTLRSPVASDLRLLTVAIKASHDLERVGDEARNIAKRSRKIIIKNSGQVGDTFAIEEMAERSVEMISKALKCFIEENPQGAREVLEADAEVDRLNKQNYRSLIKLAKDDPDEIGRLLDLIFISKSLERIADHATNLAEEVIYLTTAHDTRHSVAED